MKASELKERTLKFGVNVIRLVKDLPETPANVAVIEPLVKAGTMVGAQYRHACCTRNRWDFTSAMKTVEETTDETLHWFKVMHKSELVPMEKVEPLIKECEELLAIFTKSRRVADQHLRDNADSRKKGRPHVDEDDIPF